MTFSARLSKEKVDAVPPESVRSYLQDHGWTQDLGLSSDDVLVFRLPTQRGAEVWLPLRHDFADYALRVTEVLDTVAVVENRSLWDVFNDVAAQHDAPRHIGTGAAPLSQPEYPLVSEGTPLPELIPFPESMSLAELVSQLAEKVESFERYSREEGFQPGKWSELEHRAHRIEDIALLVHLRLPPPFRRTDVTASFCAEMERQAKCLKSLASMAPPDVSLRLQTLRYNLEERLVLRQKKPAA